MVGVCFVQVGWCFKSREFFWKLSIRNDVTINWDERGENIAQNLPIRKHAGPLF
jgi:hypothetical protein